jgi:transposase-like protein
MTVDWAGIAALGERRVLDALQMALNGKSISDIERETGIPASSLYSIRKDGPFAHQKQGKAKVGTTSSA